jgi:integrase
MDFTTCVWTVPAERMKAGKEHRVPLCSRAVEVLKVLKAKAQNDFVFPSHSAEKNSHMSLGSCLVAMKRMAGFEGFTPHGLRSTFRDWAAETTNFANETLELALAHTIKNKAEAAYRRQDQLEKRAKLMQIWCQFVNSPVIANSVLPLHKTQN